MTADTPAATPEVEAALKRAAALQGVRDQHAAEFPFDDQEHLVVLAAHVATLTAKLEAERATLASARQMLDQTGAGLVSALAQRDAAVAEAKALREALFTIKRGHTDGDLGGATWRPLHQNEIKAIVDRATLAQPAADGGK